jgi:Rrf2 family protein
MALHTAAFMAVDQERTCSTRELAARLSGSEAHLSKVLQRLTKAGLVLSSRGPRGGFSLARPAGEINLLQVWEAIDGPVGDVHCMQNPPVCDGTTCLFGALVAKMNRQAREYLGGTTLADLRYDQGQLVRRGQRPGRSAG